MWSADTGLQTQHDYRKLCVHWRVNNNATMLMSSMPTSISYTSKPDLGGKIKDSDYRFSLTANNFDRWLKKNGDGQEHFKYQTIYVCQKHNMQLKHLAFCVSTDAFLWKAACHIAQTLSPFKRALEVLSVSTDYTCCHAIQAFHQEVKC